MSQVQQKKFWNQSETRNFENPKVRVIAKFNLNNPDTRKLITVEVECPNCKYKNLRRPTRLPKKKLVKLNAVGCASFDQSNNFATEYFKCEKCNFPMHWVLHFIKVQAHVDDQHHMGLMTSGPGGY